MSGVRGFAVIHILLVILLSGPAPLGIASLLVAVEKTQTELEGLDIADGGAGEEGVWDALRMHGFVIASDCKKKNQKKQHFCMCVWALHLIYDYLLPVYAKINSHILDNPSLLSRESYCIIAL